MSGLVPMITREMLKVDPINHHIWLAEPVVPAPSPDAGRVLAALAAAAVAVLVWGRGGAAVLAGTALAFLALAVWMLAAPDGDPANEAPGDPLP